MGSKDGQLDKDMRVEPPQLPSDLSVFPSDVWERVELPITSRLKKSQWVRWLIFPPVGI